MMWLNWSPISSLLLTVSSGHLSKKFQVSPQINNLLHKMAQKSTAERNSINVTFEKQPKLKTLSKKQTKNIGSPLCNLTVLGKK